MPGVCEQEQRGPEAGQAPKLESEGVGTGITLG